MEVLVAIDRIDDQLHLAAGWSRYRVKRIDPVSYAEAVDRLRVAVTTSLADPERCDCLALVERLDALGRNAKAIPIVGGVLISRSEGLDVLDELRQAVPQGIVAQRARE